jgi:DNA-binding NarL/FixJ family response regulator
MKKTEIIKVAIAEDQEIARYTLKNHLKRIPRIQIVCVSENGLSLLKEIKKVPPDVVLMDVRMNVMDGIEATLEIKKINPNIKIVAYSVDLEMHTIIKMIKAGANAYLDKHTKVDELKEAVFSVVEKGFYFNQYLSEVLLANLTNPNYVKEKIYDGIPITKQDEDLIKMIGKGFTNKKMGDALFLSSRTVEKIKTKLIEKTCTENTAGLIIFGIKKKLIPI